MEIKTCIFINKSTMSSDLFHNNNKCTCIIYVMYVKGVRCVIDLFDKNEIVLILKC